MYLWLELIIKEDIKFNFVHIRKNAVSLKFAGGWNCLRLFVSLLFFTGGFSNGARLHANAYFWNVSREVTFETEQLHENKFCFRSVGRTHVNQGKIKEHEISVLIYIVSATNSGAVTLIFCIYVFQQKKIMKIIIMTAHWYLLLSNDTAFRVIKISQY